MARINQVKVRQEADAHERASRFDKAIELLKQIVQENPRDWNTVNRIGDLYAKLSNTKAANEQYVKVARFLADDGFYLKAIALWKKVLRNDSSMLDGHMSLGDLYARQGLPAEAKQTYAFVYDEYVKVARDALMRDLDRVHPGYDLARNMGYGSEEHREALRRLGPSTVHRRSFGGTTQAWLFS